MPSAPRPDGSGASGDIDWDSIERAAAGQDPTAAPHARAALSELLAVFLPVLRRHLLRRWGVAPDRADDLLQGFIVDKLLAGGLLRLACPGRGQFRTLLLTALDRYVIDVIRSERAGHRRPADGLREASDVIAAPPAADVLAVGWARRALDQTLARVEAECNATGRPELWLLFERRVVRPTLLGEPAEPLETLVERARLGSAARASNLLVTAKRMFARVLREVLRAYARHASQVDTELRDLRCIFAHSAGRRPRRIAERSGDPTLSREFH